MKWIKREIESQQEEMKNLAKKLEDELSLQKEGLGDELKEDDENEAKKAELRIKIEELDKKRKIY